MRISAILPSILTLAALAGLAPQAARAGEIYSRQFRVGSSLYIGLNRDHAQKGTVTVKTLDGKELGKLNFAGSFVPIEAKGTYRLEFSPATFNLNFAIIKSRTSTGAYFLNLSRDESNALQAKGDWQGTQEGTVTIDDREDEALLVVD